MTQSRSPSRFPPSRRVWLSSVAFVGGAGDFTVPRLQPVYPTEGSKMHLVPPSPDQWKKRSVTPPLFSRKFYEANP
jgi:hypothetical protein